MHNTTSYKLIVTLIKKKEKHTNEKLMKIPLYWISCTFSFNAKLRKLNPNSVNYKLKIVDEKLSIKRKILTQSKLMLNFSLC